MGASRTTRKRRKKTPEQLYEMAQTQAATEAVAEIVARLLDQWTRSELIKLAVSNHFVCIDLARNIYRVGRFNLQKYKNNRWLVKSPDGSIVHIFYNKQAAVFYCLYETKQQFTKAKEFLAMDSDLGRTQEQVAEYASHLQLAITRNDTFKQDLYLARLSWARPKLALLESNLEKSILSAKYSKVWEINNHETTRTRN